MNRTLVALAAVLIGAATLAACGGWSQVAKLSGGPSGPEMSRSADFTVDGSARVTVKSSGAVVAYLMPEGVPDSGAAYKAFGRPVRLVGGGSKTFHDLSGSFHITASCDPVVWSITVETQ